MLLSNFQLLAIAKAPPQPKIHSALLNTVVAGEVIALITFDYFFWFDKHNLTKTSGRLDNVGLIFVSYKYKVEN